MIPCTKNNETDDIFFFIFATSIMKNKIFKWTLSIQTDISPENATINKYLKSKRKYLKIINHYVYFSYCYRCSDVLRQEGGGGGGEGAVW